eukprot:EG_transcript_4988
MKPVPGGADPAVPALRPQRGPPKKRRKPRLPTFHLPVAERAAAAMEDLLPTVEALQLKRKRKAEAAPAPPPDGLTQNANQYTILGSGINVNEVRVFDTRGDDVQPFGSLGLCAESQRALEEVFGYKTMTRIQQAAIPVALRKNSILGLSETGSGKTLAYLLPAVELLHGLYHGKGFPMFLGLHTLILAPTRELVQQITAEADKLLHFSTFIARCMTGGNDFDEECELLTEASIMDILVSTPSRLLQHLTEKGSSFKKVCRDLKVLIIDEMDRMMDDGFWSQVRLIISKLPPADTRQTLMFSATINEKSRRMAQKVLPVAYTTISAAPERHIPQTYIVSSLGWIWCHLMRVLLAETQQPHYKLMVFFPTKILAQLYADLFAHMDMPFVVTMMASHLEPEARKASSNILMTQDRVVMFTTDISAHGMHYPGITCVVQVGMPPSPEQYIHRLGRTGRAGQPGKGILLLMDFEECFIQYVSNLEIKKAPVPRATPKEFDAEKDNFYKGMKPILADRVQRRKLATKVYISLIRNYHMLRPVLDLHVPFRDVIKRINDFTLRMFRLTELPEVFGSKLEELGLTEEDGVKRSKHYYNTMGEGEKGKEEESEEEGEDPNDFDLARLRYWEQGGDVEELDRMLET